MDIKMQALRDQYFAERKKHAAARLKAKRKRSRHQLEILNKALDNAFGPLLRIMLSFPHDVPPTFDEPFVGLASGNESTVQLFFSLVLESHKYPAYFPKQHRVTYNAMSRLLLVDYLLPSNEFLPRFEHRWLQNADGGRPIGTRQLYGYIIEVVAMRTLRAIFAIDPGPLVDRATFNGYVTNASKPIVFQKEDRVISLTANRKEYDKYLSELPHHNFDGIDHLEGRRPLRVAELIQGYPDREIDLLPCAVVEEPLPSPIVHYPSNYGVFIAFAATRESDIALCECDG